MAKNPSKKEKKNEGVQFIPHKSLWPKWGYIPFMESLMRGFIEEKKIISKVAVDHNRQ